MNREMLSVLNSIAQLTDILIPYAEKINGFFRLLFQLQKTLLNQANFHLFLLVPLESQSSLPLNNLVNLIDQSTLVTLVPNNPSQIPLKTPNNLPLDSLTKNEPPATSHLVHPNHLLFIHQTSLLQIPSENFLANQSPFLPDLHLSNHYYKTPIKGSNLPNWNSRLILRVLTQK